MDIRLIALDMNDTTLNENGILMSRTRKAIETETKFLIR